MSRRVLVLGGAHLDRRGRISGDTAMGASNPGAWMEEIGGGAFNVARNLAILGHQVTMVSPRGGDMTADKIAAAAEAAGVIDRPFVFLDRATPSYTAILERDGNLVVALADMDLYRLFGPRRLQVRALRQSIEEAELIVCDANLPAETLTALCAVASQAGVPVAGIAISPAKVVRFSAALPALGYLFMNAAEAAALCGSQAATAATWPVHLRRKGLRAGVVTDGGHKLAAFDATESLTMAPPPLTYTADVTGAGDALAAGTLDALLRHKGLPEAIRCGIAASRITLRSPHAVAPDLTPDAMDDETTLVGAPQKVF
ncbi:MAG: carbohydrate kinase family protein [Rhizobiales bacterium]|nr:carbohydrate kinase family protein [Hyphomicrobiales bacterium]